MPDIIADLTGTKTCCENNATAAKQLAAQQRGRNQELDKGRKLYQAVETETGTLIVFLRAALARRFNGDDPAKVQAAFERGYTSEGEFLDWAVKFTKPPAGACGAAAPADFLKAITDWIEQVRKQNDEAVNQLRSDLDACRMTPWRKL